jgi:hypothetical protein
MDGQRAEPKGTAARAGQGGGGHRLDESDSETAMMGHMAGCVMGDALG